jgi:aminopeptidase N
MLVSSDERRYSWLDEGTTSFNENNARAARYPGSNPAQDEQHSYLRIAGSRREGEIMRRSAYHESPQAYGVASYAKPATVLHTLRAVLGDSVFLRGYREFLSRWRYRHPYPWDLWNTFEEVSGRDLDWFWYPWYFTTWTLDQAVTDVRVAPEGTQINVENRGRIAMPANLTITLAGGERASRTIEVEHWLAGNRTATVTLPAGSLVTRVEIDAGRHFADVDRRNNVWPR